jgi:tetratricopeptide (TPR) repeat protein
MIFKKALIFSLSMMISGVIFAQDLPMPSPNATVKQRVGLTDIEVEYSRPGVKDRKIYGGLVPYNEMWRTGANKATAITFSTPVRVADEPLEAGTYAIFTIPSEDMWTVIFSKNTEQWGTGSYKEEEDAVRIKVKSMPAEFRESMLFYFDDLRDQSATLNLHWDKTKVIIPIEVDAIDQAMQNIEKAIADLSNSFRVYHSSARFYLEQDKDLAKALEWAQKSVDVEKRYWNMTTLSMAQAANDKKKDAIKTAEAALKLAEEAKSTHYINLNKENIAAWKAKK